MDQFPLKKWLWASVGVLSLGLGLLGIFIPLLPTTPFLLLAAMCFARSSERLSAWLAHHPWLGPYIRNYREHRAITPQAKIVTLTLLWGTIGYAVFVVVEGWPLRLLLLAVAVGVTVHVWGLRTLAEEGVEEATDPKAEGGAG